MCAAAKCVGIELFSNGEEISFCSAGLKMEINCCRRVANEKVGPSRNVLTSLNRNPKCNLQLPNRLAPGGPQQHKTNRRPKPNFQFISPRKIRFFLVRKRSQTELYPAERRSTLIRCFGINKGSSKSAAKIPSRNWRRRRRQNKTLEKENALV